MTHSKYIIIIAGLLLATGFLVLAYGKPTFPIAINPSSLLAQADYWDYPSTIDFSAPPSQQSQTYKNYLGSGIYDSPETQDSYRISPTQYAQLTENQIPVGDGTAYAPESTLLGTNRSYLPVVYEYNGNDPNQIAWNQDSLNGNDSQPLDITQRDLRSYELNFSSTISPIQPKSLWEPSSNSFFQQLGTWFAPEQTAPADTPTSEMDNTADFIAGGSQDDNLSKKGPIDYLGSARRSIDIDRQNKPFVEDTASNPANQATAWYQGEGGPLPISGGNSSGIPKILDNNGVPASFLSEAGSRQQQGLVKQTYANVVNNLTGTNVADYVDCNRISGGLYCQAKLRLDAFFNFVKGK